MDAEWSVRQGLFPVDIDPKLALARVGQDILPTYLNTASYYEIVRIPHIRSDDGEKDNRGAKKHQNPIHF